MYNIKCTTLLCFNTIVHKSVAFLLTFTLTTQIFNYCQCKQRFSESENDHLAQKHAIKKPPLRVAQKIGGTGIPLISRNLAQRCVAPEFSTSIFLHRHCTTSSSFCKSMWTSFLIFAIRFSPFFCISDIEVYKCMITFVFG